MIITLRKTRNKNSNKTTYWASEHGPLKRVSEVRFKELDSAARDADSFCNWEIGRLSISQKAIRI